MADHYTRTSLRCNELQKHIEVRKVDSENQDQLISNIGDLGNTLTSIFEIVGKQTEIAKEILDHMKSTETQLNQLECQKDQTEFLSDFGDWVEMFMDDLAKKYGEKELHEAEKALSFQKRKMTLTDYESKSIVKLDNYLLKIKMSINDIKLLRELKDESNELFHNNGQTLAEAVERLNNPLPNNVNKYKAPLQRALKAIDSWRKY